MFSDATSVRAANPGRYEAVIDRDWWVAKGPNGGYLAAIVLRAVLAELRDRQRAPRSLTLHYLAPPEPGPVRIEVAVERSGGSLTVMSARMAQRGNPLVLALAALSSPRPRTRDFSHTQMPAMPTPQEGFALPSEGLPPYLGHYDVRGIGDWPFRGGGEAATATWLRPAQPETVDSCLAAALTDAWIPAVFMRLQAPAVVPTIDLTIHFREPLPLPTATPDDWTLGVYRSRHARDGFVEEDAEIWSAAGVLLAQSRQLALMVKP